MKPATGQGDELGDAANDDEGLHHQDGGGANGDEGADVTLSAGCGDQATDGQAQEEQQQGGCSQEACFLSDTSEDEVRLYDGDLHGHAATDAHAEHAAVSHAEQGLHDLIASAVGIGEGVEPGFDTNLNVAEEEVGRYQAQAGEQHAEDHV